MRKLLIAGIAASSFFLIAGKSDIEESKRTVFSLLMVNNLKGEFSFELDPACKYSNGKFEDVSVQLDSAQPPSGFIFNKVKDFTIFKRGDEIGKFNVAKIERGGLNCYGFWAGVGNCTISDSLLKALGSEHSNAENYTDQPVFLTALNSSSGAVKTQIHSAPLKTTLSEIQKKKLLEIARQKYQDQKVDQKFLKNMKIEKSISYDLDGDGTIEHFLKTSIETIDTEYAEAIETGNSTDSTPYIHEDTKIMLIWARIDGQNVTTIPISAKEGKFDVWENAYDLVDVLDIDGDTIPEVVFVAEIAQIEYAGFQIYQFINGKFQLVYFGAGSGC